jgi:hypothetical protein
MSTNAAGLGHESARKNVPPTTVEEASDNNAAARPGFE